MEPKSRPALGLAIRHLRLIPYLAQGLSNGECATALGLSRHTIESYVSDIMAEFGVSSRSRLVIACQEQLESEEISP
ncbi:MAG: hypothetical protein IT302_01160 [Dehalococcoidia bacterium]|nr:hypothetical protein [Dehalococcoidia bacterium]